MATASRSPFSALKNAGKPKGGVSPSSQSRALNAIAKMFGLAGSDPVKVFVSSVIYGFEPFRSAARTAVETLRHEPIMAEDFGASARSPQVACLQGLRDADLVILALGDAYGPVQSGSGLSATHEEYREARGKKPVIAFVQQGITPEPAQADFISEVQGWEGGLFRGSFADPASFQASVTRALHDYELATAVAPVDLAEMRARAEALLPPAERNGGYNSGPMLFVALAGGPHQKVLRPVQIEASDLHTFLHQAGLFGDAPIFDGAKGVKREIRGGAFVLEQDSGARFQIDEDGSILLGLPLRDPATSEDRFGGFPALVEEVVQHQIGVALSFAGVALERVDPTQRLLQVAIASRIDGGDYLGWKTRAEAASGSGSSVVHMGQSDARVAVVINQARPALRLNTSALVEDILVPLRRQWKSR
ncbi:DUF4062 domain-containing protein [Brevundimonas sp. BR2-1]|uniref:DUF4062 domain-containing protein n=1 Tax=Brevundimonas sp. BR2-1 TaxID=3031123 RepID=UPI0030A4AEFE